jgi:hypothetical protein
LSQINIYFSENFFYIKTFSGVVFDHEVIEEYYYSSQIIQHYSKPAAEYKIVKARGKKIMQKNIYLTLGSKIF